MSQINNREPIYIAAGDTLNFQRSLPEFKATDGWSLIYEIRGNDQAIEFTSTASADAHVINVPAATTATWTHGKVVLAGYAVKGGERQQIYYSELTIGVDLPTTGATEDTKTFAQKMVEAIEPVMLAKASGDLSESQLGETRFKYMSMEDLRTEHAYWKNVVQNEIAISRARNGLPTGRKVLPVMNIVPTGPILGQQWPYGNGN